MDGPSGRSACDHRIRLDLLVLPYRFHRQSQSRYPGRRGAEALRRAGGGGIHTRELRDAGHIRGQPHIVDDGGAAELPDLAPADPGNGPAERYHTERSPGSVGTSCDVAEYPVLRPGLHACQDPVCEAAGTGLRHQVRKERQGRAVEFPPHQPGPFRFHLGHHGQGYHHAADLHGDLRHLRSLWRPSQQLRPQPCDPELVPGEYRR